MLRITMTFLLLGWFVLGPVLTAEPKAPAPAKQGPLSTHVLNTMTGRPAAGVSVMLERQTEKGWDEVGRGTTAADGRIADLYPADKPLVVGVYRLTFETGAYFKTLGQKTFYPRVEIVFEVTKADEHYHVPLLLSAFGYSTYRGS